MRETAGPFACGPPPRTLRRERRANIRWMRTRIAATSGNASWRLARKPPFSIQHLQPAGSRAGHAISVFGPGTRLGLALLLQLLGDEEGQLQRLLGVEARIAVGVVAVGQVRSVIAARRRCIR